jgi:hypothetical protein
MNIIIPIKVKKNERGRALKTKKKIKETMWLVSLLL